jgi:hypothetical protein
MDNEEIKQPEDIKETPSTNESVISDKESTNSEGPNQENKASESTGPKGIDWIEAKAYYMESFTRSYSDVAKKYGVSMTTVERRGTDESWVKARKDLGERALVEFEENKIMEIANANKNHIALFRSLQAHSARKLYNSKDLKPNEISSIAAAIKVGIEGERLVLGLPNNVSKSEIMGKLSTDLNLPEDTLKKMDSFFKDESA